MTTATKAYVVDGAGASFTREDIRIDPLRQDEVLLRVVATGVCHTDLSWRSGAIGGDFPVVLGHETSGIVEATGREDSPFSPGDRVVIAITHHCGVCRYCESGTPVLCPDRDNPPARFTRPDGSGVVQVYGVGRLWGTSEMSAPRVRSSCAS